MRYLLFRNNRPPQESERTLTTKVASTTDDGSSTSIKKTMTRFLLLLFYKDTDNRQVQQRRRQRRRRRTRGRHQKQKHPTQRQQVNNDYRIRQSIPKLIYIIPIQTSGLHGMNTTVDRTVSNKMHNNYALNNHQHVQSTASKRIDMRLSPSKTKRL